VRSLRFTTHSAKDNVVFENKSYSIDREMKENIEAPLWHELCHLTLRDVCVAAVLDFPPRNLIVLRHARNSYLSRSE